MSELIFVTTENCELCKKAENKIRFLKPFYQIREVDVQEDHKEFLLRIPVLLKNNKVIEEGIEKASGVDVADKIIEYLEDQHTNRDKSKPIDI